MCSIVVGAPTPATNDMATVASQWIVITSGIFMPSSSPIYLIYIAFRSASDRAIVYAWPSGGCYNPYPCCVCVDTELIVVVRCTTSWRDLSSPSAECIPPRSESLVITSPLHGWPRFGDKLHTNHPLTISHTVLNCIITWLHRIRCIPGIQRIRHLHPIIHCQSLPLKHA